MRGAKKVILITGGGGGIGRALALQLAAAGNHVFICGRTKDRLDETVSLSNGRIIPIVADIATDAGRVELKDAVGRFDWPLDILINNAGVQYTWNLDEEPADAEASARAIDEININLVAPILLTANLLPHIARPGGTVVNMTSLLALHPKASAPLYCATKAGLHSFTQALRYQLKAAGITVVEAVPPLVKTAMSKGRGRGKISPEQAAKEIIAGLEAGEHEIRIGKSKLVFFLNRIAPGFVKGMLAKG